MGFQEWIKGFSYNSKIEGYVNNINSQGYTSIIGVQKRLLNITEQEKDRLDNTRQTYDDQDENRNKMQMIMLSEKDKQNKYMLLAVIFVVVFVIAFFFTYIQHVKKQKSIWFDIIMILLIAINIWMVLVLIR
jgi:hypothetical protein